MAFFKKIHHRQKSGQENKKENKLGWPRSLRIFRDQRDEPRESGRVSTTRPDLAKSRPSSTSLKSICYLFLPFSSITSLLYYQTYFLPVLPKNGK